MDDNVFDLGIKILEVKFPKETELIDFLKNHSKPNRVDLLQFMEDHLDKKIIEKIVTEWAKCWVYLIPKRYLDNHNIPVEPKIGEPRETQRIKCKEELESFRKRQKGLPKTIITNGKDMESNQGDEKMVNHKNIILYGPPGTGKTYKSMEKAVEIIDGKLPGEEREKIKRRYDELSNQYRICLITFHQSYAYEDFIEGIRPFMQSTEAGESLRYECRDGIFKKMCLLAKGDSEQANNSKGKNQSKVKDQEKYVLIIDEINRGNISKILGELITLLEPDKRIGAKNEIKTFLPYSQEEFGVPGNLFIIGTMNTADKSIALVDIALRRRFDFEELMPNFEICKGLTKDMKEVLETLNHRITLRKDRDHQIGHAYFMTVKDKEGFNQIFRKNVIPLLQEYFFNDWDGLRFVLGEEKKESGDFILPLKDGQSKWARNKWQWCFDAGKDGFDYVTTLQKNYKS